MALPGARNWWEMTGSELEDMNRTRCAESPFGGRGDATCAQFSVESMGLNRQVAAPDTDENRTSEPSLSTRLGFAFMGLPGVGPAALGGLSAAKGAKQAVDNLFPNLVLIVIGIVLLLGGFFLWSARNQGHSLGQALSAIKEGGN